MLISWAAAEPGDLLEVTRTATLQPADINRVSGGRFRNNGEDAPQARVGITAYLMVYESTGLDGEPTPVTAQVFVPQIEEAEAPTFIFGPGSTGLVEACAPSRGYVDNRSWDTYNAYTLAYAGQGFVGVDAELHGLFCGGRVAAVL